MTPHTIVRGDARAAVILLAVLAGGGCDLGERPTDVRDDRLDAELRVLLEARGGLEQYRLPASDELGRIPQDPKNPLTPAKVELGRLLFHETALGVSNRLPDGREGYSCAACHVAAAGFQANVPQGMGEGGRGFGAAGEGRVHWEVYPAADVDVLPMRAPSVLNSAFQPLVLWSGALAGVGENVGTEPQWTAGTPLESNALGLHGLETQAHAGLEVHRMLDIKASRVARIAEYQRLFEEAFGTGTGEDGGPIDRMNAAFAIAAYERTLVTDQAPWQRWLRGESDAMTDLEKEGALLFFGKAGCVACHTGPALSSMTFHALGMADLDASVAPSRVNLAPTDGVVPEEKVLGRGGFTGNRAQDYQFKTPQLYNLADSPFYGHGATFSSLREVVEYKNAAVPQKNVRNLSPLFQPLGLSRAEIDALVAFLEGALRDPDLERYLPDAMPSGNCVPVNDPQARADMGCTGG